MPSLGMGSPMTIALQEAKAAAERDEVPVGAVVIDPMGIIIARDGNRNRELFDPSAHAEVLAIRAACASRQSERLDECDLWVTLEPCPMCAALIAKARIKRLYFSAPDPKGGGVYHGPRIFNAKSCFHIPEVYDGFSSEKSAQLLRAFFARKRHES